MQVSGIYKIQSKIKSERIYIGSAVDVNHRWGCHLSDLCLNKHHSPKLQRHYNKYGKDDLVFSIITPCDREELKPIRGIVRPEQFFIWAYDPYFNVCGIAGSQLGQVRSILFCKRMMVRSKGKHFSPKTEFKKGFIPWNKGIKMPPDKKINSGRKPGFIPWNKGKKASVGAIYNLRISHLGKKQSQETINKRVKKLIGHKGWNKGGTNEALKIPLLQYTLDMQLVKEWDSKSTIVKELAINNIAKCLNGSRKTAGGFVWRYKNKVA